jgi:hypothetical protein
VGSLGVPEGTPVVLHVAVHVGWRDVSQRLLNHELSGGAPRERVVLFEPRLHLPEAVFYLCASEQK